MSPLAELKSILDTGGMAQALPYLNRRVPHRFTAIYRLEGDFLRMVHFYDRLGEQPVGLLRVVPLGHSFCKLAFQEGSFVTGDSSEEPRLAGSPLRPVMKSYVGFPLLRANGEILGSFCHFDVVEHTIPDDEFGFLQQAMDLLPGYIAA